MSADWYLTITDGKGEPYTVAEFNLTYNLGPMLREAGLPSWDVLRQDRAANFGEMVGNIVRNLESDHERFHAFNPSNGWGDYEGCLMIMRDFLDAIERWPNAEVGAWL